jgi:hypothetical protein
VLFFIFLVLLGIVAAFSAHISRHTSELAKLEHRIYADEDRIKELEKSKDTHSV